MKRKVFPTFCDAKAAKRMRLLLTEMENKISAGKRNRTQICDNAHVKPVKRPNVDCNSKEEVFHPVKPICDGDFVDTSSENSKINATVVNEMIEDNEFKANIHTPNAELETFNSYNYWRIPLPEIDLNNVLSTEIMDIT